MNDPYVEAVHYWVEHDDSVDYDTATPFEQEYEQFHVHIDKRHVTIRLKERGASVEKAKQDVEAFIRRWEFDAALYRGRDKFSLRHLHTEMRDNNPPHSPLRGVDASPVFRTMKVGKARARLGFGKYPNPPSMPPVDPDDPVAQRMLSRLDRYHQGRETFAAMAYFCLTMLENNAPPSEGDGRKRTSVHYAISRKVLNGVSRLSSEKGGLEARKRDGINQDLTQGGKDFLIAAVQAFIRRAAERAANPTGILEKVTLGKLPPLN